MHIISITILFLEIILLRTKLLYAYTGLLQNNIIHIQFDLYILLFLRIALLLLLLHINLYNTLLLYI